MKLSSITQSAMAIAMVAILTLTSSSALAADTPTPKIYTCQLDRVLDGDTVKVICPDWPEPFVSTSLRVHGIDSPESSRGQAKCVKELRLGLLAKAWAKRLFEGATTVSFVWAGTKDKYGGRIDAHVILPNGKDWAAEALSTGFARPYGIDNLTKSDWCAKAKI
jgi:micrococcal nuclease